MAGNLVRYHMCCHGQVQGVGFRYRAMQVAGAYGLTGWVRNVSDYVEMEVQGSADIIECMMETLEENSFIVIERVEKEEIPLKEETKFRLEW